MSGRLRSEAWTLPTSATFEKKVDIPMLAGSSGNKELSAYSDNNIVISAEDFDDIGSDIISSSTGSLIRVYDGATIVDEFIAERVERNADRPGTYTISGPQINGIIEKCAVYPYNYPNDNPEAQDWIWGGENVLPDLGLGDLGHVREEWQIILAGERYGITNVTATGGTYTLTVNGNTTSGIAPDASAGTIESELEGLAGVTDVTVVKHEDDSYTIVFENPKNLATDATADTSGLTGGSLTFSKNNDGFDTGASPQFTITVDGQTTSALDWDATAREVEGNTGLQGLSNITDVTVSGSGEWADPWVIVFYEPPDPATLTVSFLAGTAITQKITEGDLDPAPITRSQLSDERVEPVNHGTYDDPPIQVVTNNLDTGADWALLVNATGQFAGSQLIVNVTPGQTYQASIRVKPTVAGKYRLVIRDLYENPIKATSPFEVSLTAGSYQELSISDVVIPSGVTEVIFRVAVVSSAASEIDDFYVNWQGATLEEGQAAATPGQIVRQLIENAQDERTAFTFLDISGFSDTVDSDGTSWPSELSFTAFFGGNSHMGLVLDDLNSMGDSNGGYEWNITPKASPSGGFTHDLELYVPGGGGTDHTASAGGPSVTVGGKTPSAQVVQRIPAFTDVVAHGFEGLYLEDADTSARTNFGRWERIVDAEHLATSAALQEFTNAAFANQSNNLTAAQATVRGDDQNVPLVDYDVGDTIWWQFPQQLSKEARRVRRISWSHDDIASYQIQGSRVFSGEGAIAAAVDKLLNQLVRRRRRGKAGTPILGGSGGAPTVVVAASDASDLSKSKADFVCSGTNDEEVIFEAIASLGSVKKARVLLTEGGFEVDVSGTFGITLTPNPPQFITLQGMGMQVTEINQAATVSDGTSEVLEVAGPFTITDLTLSGFSSGTSSVDMLHISASGDVRIVRVEVVSGNRYGIWVDSCDDVIIRDCLLDFCDRGIFASGSGGVIVDNIIRDTGKHAIELSGASDFFVARNQIVRPGQDTDNTYDGILVTNTSDRNDIRDNRIISDTGGNEARYGVNIDSGTGNSYLGNRAVGTFGTAAYRDVGTSTVNTWPAAAAPQGDNLV